MTSQTVPSSFQEKLLLFSLASVQFTAIVDFMIMMPLGPFLMKLFAISPAQFSYVVSAYALTAGVSGFFGSFLVDRFDRKRVLIFLYFGFLIGTLACGLAPNYYMLLFARAATGAFGGIMGSQVFAIVGDAIPVERRGRAMGVVMTAFSFASVIGVPAGLYFANLFSWHAPFLFLVVIGMGVWFSLWRTVPNLTSHLKSGRPIDSPLQTIAGIAGNPAQVAGLALTAMLMLGHFTIIPFLSPYMVANVGFLPDQLPYIYFFGGIATIFTSPFVGWLTDRYGAYRVFVSGALLALVPIMILSHLGPTSIPLVLIVTTCFFAMSSARFVPSTTMVTSTVQPRVRGAFMSINNAVQNLASGSAAMIAGRIVSRDEAGQFVHYNRVAYVAAFASLCCVIIAKFVKPASGQSTQTSASNTEPRPESH